MYLFQTQHGISLTGTPVVFGQSSQYREIAERDRPSLGRTQQRRGKSESNQEPFVRHEFQMGSRLFFVYRMADEIANRSHGGI